jgi:hypothetical protein
MPFKTLHRFFKDSVTTSFIHDDNFCNLKDNREVTTRAFSSELRLEHTQHFASLTAVSGIGCIRTNRM